MAKLTAREIYEKQFSTSLKGYNQEEVDAFLDIILEDYQEFNNKIFKLENEVEMLRDQTQKQQFRNSNSAPSNNNIDLLQRVSNLERAVFGKNN